MEGAAGKRAQGTGHRQHRRSPRTCCRRRCCPGALLKRDLLLVIERLVSLLDDSRIEMLARQHGIRQKRDEGGVKKTFMAFVRRADKGTLSRLLVESGILLAAMRSNPTAVLKEAAAVYKVDTDAITTKVRQEFAAKAKAKKTAQLVTKVAKKPPDLNFTRGGEPAVPPRSK